MVDEKFEKAAIMAKPKKLEVASRAGEIALATLREFATLFPMLHLREAAGVALIIVQTVQVCLQIYFNLSHIIHYRVGNEG